jgi:hypothetical protein
MSAEMITPTGTYDRGLNGSKKTYLIFKYNTRYAEYTNFSIELPKNTNPKEVTAIHDGYGNLELVINKN